MPPSPRVPGRVRSLSTCYIISLSLSGLFSGDTERTALVPERLAPVCIRPAPRGPEERRATCPGSLRYDRLDQARVIVLDVTDVRTGEPGNNLLRWGLKLKRSPLSPWHLCDLLSRRGTPAHNACSDHCLVVLRKSQNGRRLQPQGFARRIGSSHLREVCCCDHLPRHTSRPRNPNRRRLL